MKLKITKIESIHNKTQESNSTTDKGVKLGQ